MIANELITPNRKSPIQYTKEVWENRHLIGMFVTRDIKIKYAQTKLKLLWIVLQPLAMMLVFTFFFGYILGWKTKNIPFPVYVFSGLVIWNLFQNSILSSAYNIIDNANLFKNNNFPKIIVTIAKFVSVIIDAFCSILVLLIMMLFYKIYPPLTFFLFPASLFFTCLLGLSIVLLLQSFTYKKRDILFAIPTLLSFLIWVTPVFFTVDILPNTLQYLMRFNPVFSLLELWRYCVLPNNEMHTNTWPSILMIVPFFIFSVIVYIKAEPKFNDFL